MPTDQTTRAPHHHNAWDALASVPFVAQGLHTSMYDPMYALGSSGAFVVPGILARLEEEAVAYARGDYDPAHPDDHESFGEGEDLRIAADVLAWCDDHFSLYDGSEGMGEDTPEDRASTIALVLRTVYSIPTARAEGNAVYVGAP